MFTHKVGDKTVSTPKFGDFDVTTAADADYECGADQFNSNICQYIRKRRIWRMDTLCPLRPFPFRTVKSN